MAAAPADGAAHRTHFSLVFTNPRAAASTGLRVRMAISDPSDPSGKPPQLVRVVVSLPKGTKVDTATVPACTASDQQLMVQGTSACPEDTRVGSGTVEGDTGVGSPADPITGDDNVFNGRRQIIEAVSAPGAPLVVAVDRLLQSGRRLAAHPPAPPGGPPDAKTHIRSITFTIAAFRSGHRTYITTPAVCPARGVWTTSAAFTYADGVTERVRSSAPCVNGR